MTVRSKTTVDLETAISKDTDNGQATLTQTQENACLNCGIMITSNYCAECGQTNESLRISWQYVLNEIGSVFNLNKGIFYTLWYLIIRPGETIRNYLNGGRRKIVKPIPFLFLASFIYILVDNWIGITDMSLELYKDADMPEQQKNFQILLTKSITKYSAYISIFMAMITAYFFKLFFRKYSFNYFETLVKVFYVSGLSTFIATVVSFLLIWIFSYNPVWVNSILPVFIYLYTSSNFYNPKKFSTYLRVLISYVISYITFFLLMILVGIIYAVIMIKTGHQPFEGF